MVEGYKEFHSDYRDYIFKVDSEKPGESAKRKREKNGSPGYDLFPYSNPSRFHYFIKAASFVVEDS